MSGIALAPKGNTSKDIINNIMNMDKDFAATMILAFTFIILICMSLYAIYKVRLQQSECDYMSVLYPENTTNRYIKAINPNNDKFKHKFYDYYIKTAYNACSGGSYKNDFVNLCNLRAVIRDGVRCLDFEIYSINDEPIVSTSTSDNFFIKETYNHVKFADVMKTIQTYALSSSGAPNYKDPLIIHLRFKSNHQKMYTALAKIFEQYNSDATGILLGKSYSFENKGKNLAAQPLSSFMGKIILIVDRTNTTFLDNKDLLEYINLTSNSMFVRSYRYADVKNAPDMRELIEYNRRSLSIILPDNDINPANPSGMYCRAAGCQLVAMRYQYVDEFLNDNERFFDEDGHAFSLKPDRWREQVVKLAEPIKQRPELSYAPRQLKTDFYDLQI
jgi:hypothetical protein